MQLVARGADIVHELTGDRQKLVAHQRSRILDAGGHRLAGLLDALGEGLGGFLHVDCYGFARSPYSFCGFLARPLQLPGERARHVLQASRDLLMGFGQHAGGLLQAFQQGVFHAAHILAETRGLVAERGGNAAQRLHLFLEMVGDGLRLMQHRVRNLLKPPDALFQRLGGLARGLRDMGEGV